MRMQIDWQEDTIVFQRCQPRMQIDFHPLWRDMSIPGHGSQRRKMSPLSPFAQETRSAVRG
jgi:hypothetical protein